MGAVLPGQRPAQRGTMTRRPKKAKAAKARKTARNPMARALAGGLFRKRVVKAAQTYKRRPRHPPATGETD